MRALTIWSNAGFVGTAAELLRARLPPHRLILAAPVASNLVSGPPDPLLLDADVAFGQPHPEAAMAAVAKGKLRWIHLTTAGYTRYDDDAFRQAIHAAAARLSTSSTVYADPCAQHVMAMMLGMIRQLPSCLEAQRGERDWPMKERRARIPLLGTQDVLLLGFGAIGLRLVELLAPFGPKVTAFRRRPEITPQSGAVQVIGLTELDAALGRADHVVNLLPANPSTLKFVNAARLATMKPGARFYNVGRGDTVDQEALLAALERKHLGGAYLDVTTPEPLPPADPLWQTPNCYVTPHIAGGHDNEPERHVEHFLRNLDAFVHERPMRDVVIA